MKIDDKIRDEKAKLSPLSSGKIDKYEYLTSNEILPSDQKQIIEQAKFTYPPLGNAFQKQQKRTEEQRRKQVVAIANQNKRLATFKSKIS